MPREELAKLQLSRLQGVVKRVYEHVPLYRHKFDEAGFDPSSLTSLADLERVPFTVKDDMRSAYPFGMFAAPMRDIVRVHSSSGTTGQITVVGYTRNDIDEWSNLMARTYASGGVTSDDVVQVAYGYGLFTGGLGAHYGSERLGALTIPVSGGNTKRQVQILKDFGVTVLACTPSYALLIAETAMEMGIDPRDLPLRVGVFGAEPWSESMRAEIQQQLGVLAIDIYGLTEIIGPGVAMECERQAGLHINEDHFYPEIIDPATGRVLPDGQKGELVITTLTKEGTPILRYRTRDITYLDRAPCACGRSTARMHRVLGRTDDMLIIRGVNVFPSQIEEVILKVKGIEPHYQLIVERRDQLDELEVQVEMNEGLFSDEIRNLERIEKTIEADLYATLNIHTRVRLVEPKSIARSEGKAKRIIDKRNV